MRRVWEMPEVQRKKRQGGKTREMLIGAYAPHEPEIIQLLLSFLEKKKKYPLHLAHAIIDRFASMSMGTIVVTHDEVMEFIQGIPDDFAIAKGPCACRIHTAEELGPDGRDLARGNLEFCRQTPLNVDIQIGKCGKHFGKLDTYTFISREELLDLERECHNLGLVANIYMVMGGEGGICHCSSRTCAPFMANEAIGFQSNVIKKGAFIARTDPDLCTGSGACDEVCHFKARRLVERDGARVSETLAKRCYGCGLCADVCPEGAIAMIPRGGKG